MNQIARLTLISLALSVVSLAYGTPNIDVPAVSGSAYTIKSGEVRKAKHLRNGEEDIQTSRLIGPDTMERTFGNGCTVTFITEDVYSPNLTWSNCSPGPWGTGKAVDIRKKGNLWPLKVGNVVHYKFTVINSEGKSNIFGFRSCEVTDTVMAEAASKQYPTYKIHCTEHVGTRTFYYAPAVEATARMEENHQRTGQTLVEFVERLN